MEEKGTQKISESNKRKKNNVIENQDGGQNEQEMKARMAAKQQGKLWKG